MASSLGSNGSTTRWRKRRARIIKRDKGLCQMCLARGRTTIATEVDHKTPRSEGGDDSDSNLWSLCNPCHTEKTAIENGSRKVGCDVDGYPLVTV